MSSTNKQTASKKKSVTMRMDRVQPDRRFLADDRRNRKCSGFLRSPPAAWHPLLVLTCTHCKRGIGETGAELREDGESHEMENKTPPTIPAKRSTSLIYAIQLIWDFYVLWDQQNGRFLVHFAQLLVGERRQKLPQFLRDHSMTRCARGCSAKTRSHSARIPRLWLV